LAAGLLGAVLLWNQRPHDSAPDLAGERPGASHRPNATSSEDWPEEDWPEEDWPEIVDDTVAVLLQATGAQWGEMELPTSAGSPLSPGWLRLKAGLAHIEFYSGAHIILEGPADLQIISRMEAYCAHGKLRATVPPQAQGFQIGSPKMRFIDRGTEFGLLITENGPTEVHVFEGKVEFDELAPADRKASPTELTTGQGIRLDDSGQLSPIKLNSAAFQTAADLIANSKAETRRSHQEWLGFCTSLRQDPTLLVHFMFQPQDAWNRTLVNEVPGSPVQDGAIVGCSWSTGRWMGKRGLEFTRVSDRVRFQVPGEFSSITLMAWVRVDALPNRFNSLMITDGWEVGEPHWHIGSNGTLELGVQGPNKKSNAHYEAYEAVMHDRLGQWIHLAAVYNGEGGYVAHFIDGQQIAHLPLKFDIPIRLGDVELGNWNVATHRNDSPLRNFNGCIDEFVLYSRALTEPEIEQFHAFGRPPW
jgi:hypothetical protein